MSATATLPKKSATPASSPVTALPKRPQQARKLVKKAIVSKKSVIRYMTVPKRHRYQYVLLVVPSPWGPTSDGGAFSVSGPVQAAPKGRAGLDGPQSRLEAPQMRK